jgi:hypothetical protein
MNKKILIFITIILIAGGVQISMNYIEYGVPAGTIKISNQVNGKNLVVKELTLWDKTSGWYYSLLSRKDKDYIESKAGYVVQGKNNLKSFCWLPIPQQNKTIAFQYVCSGEFHNYYLDIQDNVTSHEYLRLMVRQQLASSSSWNVTSKDDGSFTYDNLQDSFKGYYIAIKEDGIAKVYFGDIGPTARWNQAFMK